MTRVRRPSPPAHQDRVFSALLRYWRGNRGLSQLDLALTAGVSSRHLSFLETGRSRPSEEMVMLLAEALDMPLRDRNELLGAAGFPQAYPATDVSDLLDGPVGAAVRMMLDHHEPFPLAVLTRLYDLVAMNRSAERLFDAVGIDTDEPNLVRLLFSAPVRGLVRNWEAAAGTILRRLQREALHRPHDEQLAGLVADLLAVDGVPEDWRQPRLATADEPVVPLELRTPTGPSLSFMTTVTIFSAPQNLTLDELQIESWFPLDETTEAACRALAGE